ncbi:MAG TPA: hypothetical protein VLZ75_11615 [Chitinophagales bacterium]|nr:hypothetical protein [Chitinophagales bacterium]
MQWILTYPVWTVFLVVILAAGLTYLLYKNSFQKFEVNRLWIYLLAFLRFSAFSLIGLLLLNPLMKHVKNEKITPVILMLEDHSASIKEGMSLNDLSEYQTKRKQLQEKLSDKYTLHSYRFGLEINDTIVENIYTLQGTDIDKSLNQLAQKHIGQHIGAVILSSDGIYNQGSNPVYNTQFSGIPIYTIALGDTTSQTDAWIQRLRYNDIIYLGDELQVLVDVAAANFDQKTMKVELKNAAGQIIQTQNVLINSKEWNHTIDLKITTQNIGIQKFTVQISPLANEKSYQNNQQEFYIQVIDGRQKVVLLYDAPHPDLKLIKEAINQLKNIDLNVVQVNDLKAIPSDVDLWILHGLPSFNNANAANTLNKITASKAPIWWILSAQTNLNIFNQMQTAIQFQQVNRLPNETTPIYESGFQKFFVSDEGMKWLSQVPPLLVPYGQYQLSPSTEIIWKQKIGTVTTANPLLVAEENNGRISAILLGEGIWRWGMQEFLQYDSKSRTFEWIERLLQFLANKKDHRPFRIRTGKNIYHEGEWISLEGAIYNESAQMINTSDVKAVIKGNNNYSSEFLMDKTLHAYTYNIGKLPAGEYEVQASTTFNNKKLHSVYKFAVQKFDIESYKTKADFQLLNTIAMQHQGKMFTLKNMDGLFNEMENNHQIQPIIKEVSSSKSIIDYQLILLLIFSLLFIEWFLRRFFGQY